MKHKIILLLLIFVTSCGLFAQGIKSLAMGQKIIQVQSNTMNMKMEIMGQQMEQTMTMSTTGELSVVELKSESAKIELKQTKMKMSTSTMGQEINVDTDKPDENEFSKEAINNLKKIHSFMINEKGEIVNDEVDNELNKAMYNSPFEGMEKNARFGFFLNLSAKPSVNSTWTETFGSDSTKIKFIYTITSIENDLIYISFTGTMKVNTHSDAMGKDMETNLSSTINGTASVNAKTFFVVKRNSIIDMKGFLDMAGKSVPIEMSANTEEIYNY